MTGESTTVDPILRGLLSLEQPRHGYRFNIDALLVADFARRRIGPPPSLVDLGAGCGIVGLLLARWWSGCRVLLVERDHELAQLAASNIRRNGLERRVVLVEGDLREGAWAAPNAPAALVSNPPFFRVAEGRVSPNPMIAAAKHEITCSLEDLVAAAALLEPGAHLALIHAAGRREELGARLIDAGFGGLQLQSVIPVAGRAASRILVSARRGMSQRGRPEELEPIVVNDPDGRYSPQVEQLLAEGPGGTV